MFAVVRNDEMEIGKPETTQRDYPSGNDLLRLRGWGKEQPFFLTG